MASREGTRPRTLSVVFGAYFLLVILLAFVIPSSLTSGWYDATVVRWILSSYVVLGALMLTCICTGAVARQATLDLRLDELEAAERRMVADARRDAASEYGRGAHRARRLVAVAPSDRDVEQLLADLETVAPVAQAATMSYDELATKLDHEVRPPIGFLRVEREAEKLRTVRGLVAAHAVGPAIASIGLLGVCAALLPAADGMLAVNVPLRTVVVAGGMACFIGLVAYAAAAFRRLGRPSA